MRSPAACTIATNSYLAFARVFADSFRRFHPGVEVYLCLADRADPEVDYSRLPFTVVFAHDLDIPAFPSFAFRYELLEFTTALKPFFLDHLRQVYGVERALYFDPDILVCSPLTGLEEELEDHDLILTPHITSPFEDILHYPSDRAIVQAGVYNLGFLGIRLDASTRGFLEWWKRRLYRLCLMDLSAGLFVDQSWMSMAPAFLDRVGVVRDPAYNVAYWNLPHREVRGAEGGWRVDGRPLGFFHFSGIDLDSLDAISRHQDRLTLELRPEVAPLFEEYRELLLAAGHERYRKRPYGFGRFHHCRKPVSSLVRDILRRVDPYGRRWHDPFEDEVPDSFLDWLVEPVPLEQGAVNRLALSLWESREDLVQGFPRVLTDDLPSFIRWLREAEARDEIESLALLGIRDHNVDLKTRQQWVIDLLDLVYLGCVDGLTDWLNEPVPETSEDGRRLTRFAGFLYDARPDLHEEYPDCTGRDLEGFARWCLIHGRVEHRLPPELVEPIAELARIEPEEPPNFAISLAMSRLGEMASAGGPEGLVEWLGERQGDLDVGPPIPRMAMICHQQIPKLKREMPDPLGTDRQTLASWLSRDARFNYPVADRLRSSRRPGAAERGINLGGNFEAVTGVGQIARSSAEVLEHLGIPLARTELGASQVEIRHSGTSIFTAGMPFAVSLIHANADMTLQAVDAMPFAVRNSVYKIGYWFWELAEFPAAWADRFACLDEVWAPSRFAFEAFDSFEARASVPVRLVPPYVPPPRERRVDRAALGLDDGAFVFLFAFDAASVSERKNPLAAIETIRRLAPAARREVALLLKVSGSSRSPGLLAELREAADGLPVVLKPETLSRQGFEEMLAASDAVLSLHRSEGLGLLPIEALYLGKPVVGTAYGGVVDFLDESTGFPVSFREQVLDRDHPPYPRGAVWAEPCIDHAVAQIQSVLEDPEAARERAAAGRRRVRQQYGLEAAAGRYERELARIFERLGSKSLKEG